MNYTIDTDQIRTIEYSRRDALRDGAILPIDFGFGDGPISYIDKDEKNVAIERLSQAAKDQQRPGLRTGLDTGLAKDILDQALVHCHKTRAVSPTSKLLVIAKDQASALDFKKYIFSKGFDCALAISDEGKEAISEINRFKNRTDCWILITCAMAYEGLNVPEISVIAFLTNYRSKPWLEQSFGRAVRINPREVNLEQRANIFLPRDPLAMEVVESIKRDQNEVIKLREKTERGSGGSRSDAGEIIPLSSELIDIYFEDLDEFKQPQKLGKELATEVKPTPLAPKQKQESMRKRIDSLAKKIAWRRGIPFDGFNRDIKKKFGKSRTHMTIDELAAVCSYLESFDLNSLNTVNQSN
jgi:superfamily II DNA or RNA helicase